MGRKSKKFDWVTRDLIEEAAAKWISSPEWFDDERLHTGNEVRIRKYFVEVKGRRFAPKHLLRLAYYLKEKKYFDDVVSTFNGGQQTNKVFENFDFKVGNINEEKGGSSDSPFPAE